LLKPSLAKLWVTVTRFGLKLGKSFNADCIFAADIPTDNNPFKSNYDLFMQKFI